MRRLTYLVLFLGLLYGGYWFIARTAFLSSVEDGLSQARDDGWTIAYDDLSVIGFPSRFDATLSDLRFATPDGSFIWEAPFFQALMLSYRPNEVIAVWPARQTLSFSGIPHTLAARDLRASLAFDLSSALDLAAVTLESAPLLLSRDDGWSLGAERLLFALRDMPVAERPNSYDIYLDIDGLAPPEPLRAALDTDGALPATLGQSLIDLDIVTTAPLNLRPPSAPVRLQSLSVARAAMQWGSLQLGASGSISIDSRGIPDGRIDLTIRDWDRAISMAVALGWVEEGVAPTWRNIAATLADGGEELTLPLAFRNGFMSIGPVPLGPAPRF
jgi:hypothetical protein